VDGERRQGHPACERVLRDGPGREGTGAERGATGGGGAAAEARAGSRLDRTARATSLVRRHEPLQDRGVLARESS